MSGIHWTSYVVIGSVVGILAFGGLTAPLGGSGGGTGGGTGGQVAQTYLNVSIVAGAIPGTYVYNLTSIRAPHGTPIIFTITNYDPRAGPVMRPSDAEVIGTLTGYEVVQQNHITYATHVLPMNTISHTFSIRMAGFYLNVPVPPSLGGVLPTTVTVTIALPTPGPYPFQCYVLSSLGLPGLHGTVIST